MGDICEIYFVGGEEFTSHEIQQLNRIFGESGWHKLTTLSEFELLEMYRKAYCLFYPSKTEGFGLPVIEAQALGCPVICYPSEAVVEIAGDSVVYLNKEHSNFRELVESVELSVNRKEWIEKGRANSLRYTANKMAKSYYKSLLEI
jgi:mannosyltransferase